MCSVISHVIRIYLTAQSLTMWTITCLTGCEIVDSYYFTPLLSLPPLPPSPPSLPLPSLSLSAPLSSSLPSLSPLSPSLSLSPSPLPLTPTIVEADEIRRLSHSFNKLDLNKNGSLSVDEFLSIPELQQNPLVRRVIDILDTDRNGEVDFQGKIQGGVVVEKSLLHHCHCLMCLLTKECQFVYY